MINFLKTRFSTKFLYILILLLSFRAEADTSGPNFPTLQDQTYQPSLAVVIGILGVMFLITMVLIVYTKCYGPAGNRAHNGLGPPGSSKRFQGLERRVVESLPFFRFSSLRGSKEGLECAVCLSRFEDVEVLRLLPKCKHAFHVECIDHWLARSASCPLCRDRVGSEDLKLVANSNSMRLLWSNDRTESGSGSGLGPREETSELFVQREESRRRGSSWRFRIGREEEKESCSSAQNRTLHKLNHKIVISDFAFNNRWSDLRASDLASLNSEMLNHASSARFVKEEAEAKKLFENKVGTVSGTSSSSNSIISKSSGQQRSVSEITVFTRYADSGGRSRSSPVSKETEKDDRIRKVWLPIAKRTMQWFANKDKSQFPQTTQRQSLDV